MARYSPELLAALRTRYEQTDQPMTAISADFGIGITTLQTLVRKNGWTPRSRRMRDCPPAVRLLEEAEALVADLPERQVEAPQAAKTHEMIPSATLALSVGGSAPAIPHAIPAAPTPSPVERIETLLVKELEAEEAARAELALRPRSRNEAERCARTLSVLTQTLQTVQKLRAGGTGGRAYEYDDVPEDMDAFRNELARRIECFVEARVGKERMALDRQFAKLTDDELKELAAAGRERGMRALLEPPPGDADDAVGDDTRLAGTEV